MGPASSPSWTCGARITSFVFGKATSGRRHPSPPLATMSTLLCREGIQMDHGKVTAVKEWPLPQSVKELQRFLGFANFYHRFIKDFSLHTAQLTSMLRGQPKSLSWDSSFKFQVLFVTYTTIQRLYNQQ